MPGAAMAEDLNGYRLEQAEARIVSLASEVHSLRTEMHQMKEAEDARERSQLKWGVSALGAAVITLASVIWAYRGEIFR